MGRLMPQAETDVKQKPHRDLFSSPSHITESTRAGYVRRMRRERQTEHLGAWLGAWDQGCGVRLPGLDVATVDAESFPTCFCVSLRCRRAVLMRVPIMVALHAPRSMRRLSHALRKSTTSETIYSSNAPRRQSKKLPLRLKRGNSDFLVGQPMRLVSSANGIA